MCFQRSRGTPVPSIKKITGDLIKIKIWEFLTMQYLFSSDIGRPWYFDAQVLITELHDYEGELILQKSDNG